MWLVSKSSSLLGISQLCNQKERSMQFRRFIKMDTVPDYVSTRHRSKTFLKSISWAHTVLPRIPTPSSATSQRALGLSPYLPSRLLSITFQMLISTKPNSPALHMARPPRLQPPPINPPSLRRHDCRCRKRHCTLADQPLPLAPSVNAASRLRPFPRTSPPRSLASRQHVLPHVELLYLAS